MPCVRASHLVLCTLGARSQHALSTLSARSQHAISTLTARYQHAINTLTACYQHAHSTLSAPVQLPYSSSSFSLLDFSPIAIPIPHYVNLTSSPLHVLLFKTPYVVDAAPLALT